MLDIQQKYLCKVCRAKSDAGMLQNTVLDITDCLVDQETTGQLGLGKQCSPDQTAPRGAVWSGSTLFAILSASFGCINLW